MVFQIQFHDFDANVLNFVCTCVYVSTTHVHGKHVGVRGVGFLFLPYEVPERNSSHQAWWQNDLTH